MSDFEQQTLRFASGTLARVEALRPAVEAALRNEPIAVVAGLRVTATTVLRLAVEEGLAVLEKRYAPVSSAIRDLDRDQIETTLKSDGAAATLKVWREQKDLTQKAASAKINRSQSLWASWELGKRKPEGVDRVELEKLTQIPIDAWDRSLNVG